MQATRLPAAGYRRAPWRNGRGVSLEVARGGAAAEEAPGWQVSLTTIAADGPFSDWRGHDRVLTPQDHGVILAVAGAAPAATAPLVPFAFAGDDAVDCRLAAGPARVINAMVARRWGTQAVDVLRGAAAVAIAAPVVVLHALDAARVTLDGAAYDLAAGDSLLIADGAGARAAVAAAPGAVLWRAAFRPHARPGG